MDAAAGASELRTSRRTLLQLLPAEPVEAETSIVRGVHKLRIDGTLTLTEGDTVDEGAAIISVILGAAKLDRMQPLEDVVVTPLHPENTEAAIRLKLSPTFRVADGPNWMLTEDVLIQKHVADLTPIKLNRPEQENDMDKLAMFVAESKPTKSDAPSVENRQDIIFGAGGACNAANTEITLAFENEMT
jgi:hypothetical protein